jgi:signal transduction histidine kinase
LKVISLSDETYFSLLSKLRYKGWKYSKRFIDLQNFIIKLEEYLEAYQDSGLQPSVILSSDGECDLNNNVAKALYEMVQEVIDNSLRHARAENVWITINCHDSRLDLAITDDGKGFAYPAAEGRGLKTVEAIAQDIQAAVTVKASSGKGTSVTVQVAV